MGVGGDSDRLLELEPTRSKDRGLLSYNNFIDDTIRSMIMIIKDMMYTTRLEITENSGGVACYVNKELASKYIRQKSIDVDNLLELNLLLNL